MKTEVCNLCNSKDVALRYNLDTLKIYKCRKCGLVFTSQQSLQEKPREIYSKDYFTELHPNFFGDCSVDYKTKLGKSPKLKRFEQALVMINKYKNGGKLLDLGCATGVFLDMAEANGFEVFGIDISDYAAGYARKNFNIPVETGTLSSTKHRNSSFDVITLHDCIEHVPDPTRDLRKAHALLKKEGILFVHTINEDSLMCWLADILYYGSFKLIKKPVRMIHPIHHITHFSEKTLRIMLENCGFKVVNFTKSEMPIANIEGGIMAKAVATVLYFFSNLINKQHEIKIVAVKC